MTLGRAALRGRFLYKILRLLYGLVILRHGRRQLLSIGVTDQPTAEWIARQITEAFAWDNVPRYLVRDRDGAYGDAFIQRLRTMGIRDHPIAPRSPWQTAMSSGSLALFAGSA
jgi:hypothetical protein